MKTRWILIVALIVLAAATAFAAGVPAPATPRLMIDAAGNLLSSSSPLPVVATGTPATVTTTASQTTYILDTSVDTVITPLSGRREWLCIATGSFYMAVGSTTVNTSSVPMIGAGGPDSDAVPLAFRASVATVALTIQQRK